MLTQETRPKGCFKYFNMWANHKDFTPAVTEIWNKEIDGVEQYKLCKRLKLLKQPLKKLNKLHFSHISVRAINKGA